MKNIPTNPFLITGYQGPDYFCDREKETASLMSALKNGRNITLISPRRMGKTGLIKNVFYYIQKDNQQKNGDMSNKQLLLKNFMNVK